MKLTNFTLILFGKQFESTIFSNHLIFIYYKGLKTLGPGGRTLVKKGGLGGIAVAGLLSSPTVRKFAKGALTGAGIGFLAGNKKQQKLVTGPNVNIRKKFSLSPGEKGGFSSLKS